MNDFDKKYHIIDEPTPVNAPLSAKYKRFVKLVNYCEFCECINIIQHCRSFAYYTIQERLPVIITKIIDQISRDKDELAEIFGGEVTI